MTAAIVLTGLSVNDPTPGVYEQINFAQGPVAGSGSPRTAIILADFISSGTTGVAGTIYGPDTQVPCQTESDVIALTGSGSEAHRMWLKWTKANASTSVYLGLIADPAGTAAHGTFTFLTVPTGGGTVTVYINDEQIQYSFLAGDALATTTAALAAVINGQTRWPVTAAQATVTTANDSILITAKQTGPRGNFIGLQTALSQNTGMTCTLGTKSLLASGATADSNTTILGVINPLKYYYIVSAAEDASQFGALVTQVNTQALPVNNIRQRSFAGSVAASVATVNTIGVAINAPRAEIVWQKSSDWTPAELAASCSAIYALLENSGVKPRNNYSGFPSSTTDSAVWSIPAPRSAVGASPTDVRSALANGVTPIGRYTTGSAYLVKRITTKSLTGAVNDYRIRDAHKVTICDFIGDNIQVKTQIQFGGKDWQDDPAQGQPPTDPQIVTPRIWGAAISEVIQEAASNNMLQNVAATYASLVVQRENNPRTRGSALIQLYPVDVADQFAIEINQVA